jgi:hypothetical protein
MGCWQADTKAKQLPVDCFLGDRRVSIEKPTPTIGTDPASPCENRSWVARFYRVLSRSAKVSLLLSTVSFLWIEAEYVRGILFLTGAHVHLRYPWLYMLAIFFPWGFCVRTLWLVTRMVEGQKIEGRDFGALMVLLAALPLWSYFLLGLGIAFASTVARTGLTHPFF